MARSWPAKDVAPLIALIDDPRHRLEADETYRLSDAQARAILELRLARLTALGREEIDEELQKLAVEISDYLDILRSRQRVRDIVKAELEGDPRRIRDAAQDRDRRDRRRPRGRGPDPARGHGGDGHPCRLDQARAARHLPGAAARRQGPRRHGDEGRGFRHAAVRGEHAYADPVLLLARAGLQGEGLAAAAGGAAGARQGAGQPAAAQRRRAHHLDPAAAARTRARGANST